MTEGTQRRLAAIVSADVVEYSRLMGVDETGTLEAFRAHRAELIDAKIAELSWSWKIGQVAKVYSAR